MKLKNKIHLGTSVLLIVIVVLINTSIYFTASYMLKEADLERNAADAARTASGISSPAESVASSDLLRAYTPSDGMIRVILPNGTVDGVSVSQNTAALREREARYGNGEKRLVVETKNSSYAYAAIPVIWRSGEIALLERMESLQATDRILHILRLILIFISIIAVIPAVFSARILGAIISNPVEEMTKTMQHIRTRGTYERIQTKEKRHDELQDMAVTFNGMMDLLEENYRKQEAFVQNASHELKTPLTVIESYANLLKRRGRERPELWEESVEAIHEEAIRMKELTQQLLALARRGEGWDIKHEQIAIDEFVRETADAFEKAHQRPVAVHVAAPFIIHTDRSKLRQLLYIFLDNARKYSEEAVEIKVNKKEIRVIDRGIGIPADDLQKVFDRFYRVDRARSRKTGGFGLGLALAKEIADALDIKIRLESEESSGTTAILTFSEFSFSPVTLKEKQEEQL
ncbi:sensor histidine kinase [Domibacillus indicus]|uniref:sensor histidine kinase n=1 Tax=Domibacillus indicus TaxID=1437523 RepID=UPI000617D166|nr:HAMP domain-containing sensor histidine kinase [Domibacillus indicus]